MKKPKTSCSNFVAIAMLVRYVDLIVWVDQLFCGIKIQHEMYEITCYEFQAYYMFQHLGMLALITFLSFFGIF